MKSDINKVNYDYIKRWEGGLSRDPKDTASSHPVPDGSGYHTNMGVTWQSFHAHFPNLTARDFYSMPANLWLQIYKEGYWDVMKCDGINSQVIAEFIADWAWGSGGYYPARSLQKILNVNGYGCSIDGAIGKVTLGQLNAMIQVKGERNVFDMLYSARTSFLQAIPSYITFGAGWMNRMRDFQKYAYTLLKV